MLLFTRQFWINNKINCRRGLHIVRSVSVVFAEIRDSRITLKFVMLQ